MSKPFKKATEILVRDVPVEFFYRLCRNNIKLQKVSRKPIHTGKFIKEKDVHRPGLALAGYVELFNFRRVQIFGNTEIKYLNYISKKERTKVLKKFFSFDIPCLIITNNNKVTDEIIKLADNSDVSVFLTEYSTTRCTSFIMDFLDDQLSQRAIIHGSFIDVYGIGMLFVGKAGIGKSEIALDLVERGHRLVADDVVIATKKAESILIGCGTKLIQHNIEIRGLGIIDVKSIFGIRAIRYQKRIEVIVQLETWDDRENYERTGLKNYRTNILGVDIETISLSIFPGKNITVIAEVIALNYLCKHYGYNAAKVLSKRLKDNIKRNRKNKKQDYAGYDFERIIDVIEPDRE